jgi:protein-S-isoprenylcysteine O-methyltransferase Ste14
MSLTLFGISVAAYYFLHSLLAAENVKRLLMKRLISERYYRLAYNIIFLVLLGLLAVWFFNMEKRPLLPRGAYLVVPGLLFLITGGVWIVKSLTTYGLNEFSGLLQLKENRTAVIPKLKFMGLNALVRHPLLFGTLLIFLGIFLLSPTNAALVLAAISIVYIFIGARLEERKLEQQFGEAYRLYRQNVPMLIPFRKRRRRTDDSFSKN